MVCMTNRFWKESDVHLSGWLRSLIKGPLQTMSRVMDNKQEWMKNWGLQQLGALASFCLGGAREGHGYIPQWA